MRTKPGLTSLRRSDAGELLEWFLVSAVASVILIRWFLELAGYPKLGNGGVHIAHMLWGGLAMLIALLLFFLFLDRRLQRVATVVAGLGFGTFLDEIGKFVTSDNDYFFRPAAALIYLVFVALFLVLRVVLSGRPLSPGEALANALDIAEPGAVGLLDVRALARAHALLEVADPADPLVPALRAWLADRARTADEAPWLERLGARIAASYRAAVENPWFDRAFVVVVVADAVASVAGTIALVTVLGSAPATETATVSTVGQTVSALAGALLVLLGIPALARSRAEAYRWFRRGVLVWIVVTQVFVFYTSQLAGVAGLGVHVLSYAVVTFLLESEEARAKVRPAVSAAGAAEPRPTA